MPNAEGIDVRGRRRRAVFTVLGVLIAELLVVGAAGAATVSHHHNSSHGDATDASNEVHVTYCALTSTDRGIVRVALTNPGSAARYYRVAVDLSSGQLQVSETAVDTLVPAHRTETATGYGPSAGPTLAPVTCSVTYAMSNTVDVFPIVD